jgi:small conductance mechanosensitive channel
MEYEFMTLETVLPQVVEIGGRVAAALAIWFVGRFVIGLVRKGIAKALGRGGLDPTLQRWAMSIAGLVLNFVLVLAILGVFGIETTSFAALLAAAGLAIGAAWAGLLANFAAGVFLILFKPFKVGDEVTIAGVTGTVAEIGVFSTAIDTEANVRTIIGNGAISGAQIENFTVNPYEIVSVKVQLLRSDPAVEFWRAIGERLPGLAQVRAEPAPSATFEAVNEFGPVLVLKAACHHHDRDALGAAMLDEAVAVLDASRVR